MEATLDGMDKSPMRELVIAVGGNLLPAENRKAWLSRIAATAGLSYRVVRAAWHNEQISQETRNKLQRAAAQNEARRLQELYETLITRLQQVDSDFYREDVAALVNVLRRLSNEGLPEAGDMNSPAQRVE